MSKRNRREHGRILSVETMQRGSALDVDAAAGATSITVSDAGDFDEDGGWLFIGAQVIQFTAVDDDAGVLTLATALTAAAEQGDPVNVYDPLYEEVVDYQEALVQLDGDYDNPDPVVAEVAEGVGDLPEGDRGNAGESCTLLQIADDEWEIVGVGGRSRKSRGIRWEQDDTYTLTAGDVTAGAATMPLTHRPADEALTCVLAGIPQRPTEWTIDYAAPALTVPLGGWERSGDRLWAHYAYRKGITTTTLIDGLPYDSGIMARNPVGYYLQNETSGTTMVDSSGNGRDGTYLNTPTLGVSGMLPNSSDTSVEYVNAEECGEVSVTTYPALKSAHFTFESIINPTSAKVERNIAGRYDESSVSSSAWRLFIGTSSNLMLTICNGGTKYFTTAVGVAVWNGGPYLVGATYDGTTAKLFLNGSLVASSTPAAAMQVGTKNFRIGCAYPVNDIPFGGKEQRSSLCDYAVSDAEMAASYDRWVNNA